MLRYIILLVFGIGMLTACGPENPEGYQPGPVEQALTGATYRGEWRAGYLYEISFAGIGAEMAALVHVIDNDSAGTHYRMPARVTIDGNAVTLTFTEFDRVDHLTFDPNDQRLEGHTVYRGEPRERDLWAERVENLQPENGGKTS